MRVNKKATDVTFMCIMQKQRKEQTATTMTIIIKEHKAKVTYPAFDDFDANVVRVLVFRHIFNAQ